MTAEWVFDGGRDCLDFVNTLRHRGTGGRELLADPSALAEWLRVAGYLIEAEATERHLVEARALRESIDRLVRAAAESRRPPAADVHRLNATAGSVPTPPPQLSIDAENRPRLRAWQPADPVAAALAALAVDAIELVAAQPRVRVCAAADCGLRFLDTSPQRNRQWCSMARCGNRSKARAHYARRKDHQATGSASTP